jgi:hypothetical protein
MTIIHIDLPPLPRNPYVYDFLTASDGGIDDVEPAVGGAGHALQRKQKEKGSS